MNSKLKVGLLLTFFVAVLPLAAQQTANDTGNSSLLRRQCTTVALTSDTPSLGYRLIAPYLQRRADFQAAKLVLSDTSGMPMPLSNSVRATPGTPESSSRIV